MASARFLGALSPLCMCWSFNRLAYVCRDIVHLQCRRRLCKGHSPQCPVGSPRWDVAAAHAQLAVHAAAHGAASSPVHARLWPCDVTGGSLGHGGKHLFLTSPFGSGGDVLLHREISRALLGSHEIHKAIALLQRFHCCPTVLRMRVVHWLDCSSEECLRVEVKVL